MRSVLVLGGSSDIGKDIVIEYVERGWSVLAHGNSWSGKALSVIGAHTNVSRFQLDLSEVSEVESFIKSEKKLTELDAIINCVGYWQNGSYANQSIQELETAFRVNVFSPFLFTQAAIPTMLDKKWGRIVHLGSIGVKFGGGKSNVAYSWSKHSLEFIPSECLNWAKDNVLVNVVRIAATDTRIHALNSLKDMEERISHIPIGRLATTKEVAKAVVWLGTEDNQLITGQVIPISGGE